MRNSQHPCHLIQEDIAWNRELSQEDKNHVLSCSSCSEIADQVAELDSLVREVIEQEIPTGFADRVVARIGEEENKGDNLFLNGFLSWKRYFIRELFNGRLWELDRLLACLKYSDSFLVHLYSLDYSGVETVQSDCFSHG